MLLTQKTLYFSTLSIVDLIFVSIKHTVYMSIPLPPFYLHDYYSCHDYK